MSVKKNRINKSSVPLELVCEPDTKNPKRIVCKEPSSKEASLVKIKEEEDIETREEERESGPRIIIGAVNIGTRPVKDFFRSRWERFYHEKKPLGSFHFVVDIILIIAVISLLAFNLFLLLRKTSMTTLAVESKATVEPLEVRLGERTTLKLFYLNSAGKKINDAKYILVIPDGLKIISTQGGRWNATNSTVEIGDVPSLSSGAVEVVLESARLGKVEISALFQYLNPQGKQEEQINRLVLNTPAPELKLQSYARYYSPEGEQLGRGPLPPTAGKTTKYYVFWVLEKTINPMVDVVVEGKLADSVKWVGFAPLGGELLSYDSLTRKVVWKAGKDNTSVIFAPESKGAIFEISLTPDSIQIGKEALLMSDIKIQGRDEVTNTLLNGISEDITTNLIFDAKAIGRGIVGK